MKEIGNNYEASLFDENVYPPQIKMIQLLTHLCGNNHKQVSQLDKNQQSIKKVVAQYVTTATRKNIFALNRMIRS